MSKLERGIHGPNPCFRESRGGGVTATVHMPTVALAARRTAAISTPIDRFDARAIETMDWEGGSQQAVELRREIPTELEIATTNGVIDPVVLASVGSMAWRG